MAETEKSFEQSMRRLEEIVKHLETGDMPLNDTMSLFEEGTALVTSCSRMLDEAEQKVIKLKKGADGQPVELPFEEEMQ